LPHVHTQVEACRGDMVENSINVSLLRLAHCKLERWNLDGCVGSLRVRWLLMFVWACACACVRVRACACACVSDVAAWHTTETPKK
jgi:hypothetical protein